MTQILKTDALIFGGGIAGLWLLNRLHSAGYSAWLLEQDALGTGQSIASQGMIHGGIKYALGGKLTSASSAIADMPAHWTQCLAGHGDVDLTGCRLLSEAYYMWPRSSLRSRLNAFLGSKALEARVAKVEPQAFPEFFRGHVPGPLYRLQDIVLDVPSLLRTLADKAGDNIFRIDWRQATLGTDNSGNITGLALAGGPTLQARQYIFCCGAGTESLMHRFNLNIAKMQRRPLRMVMVAHRVEAPLYVHCVAEKLTMTPEVTITTHRNAAGDPVWYLGGELAERGAACSEAELVLMAKAKLAELFPWCDLRSARWATVAVDRAEQAQAGGKRPDDISVVSRGNLIVGWPTKLTLAPNLAGRIAALMAGNGIRPGAGNTAAPDFLPRPGVAATPWERL